MTETKHPFGEVDVLRLCLELEAFHICRPIHVDDFIKQARERGVDVRPNTLERLDQLGILRPFFYCTFPVIRYKKEFVDETQTRFRRGEFLSDDEDWDGPTNEELLYPSFSFRDYITWCDHGHLIYRDSFIPWDERMPKRGPRASGKPYYSIFQVADLYQVLNPLTFKDLAFWFHDLSEGELLKRAKAHQKHAKMLMDLELAHLGTRPEASLLCQVLSTRYFPKTQSDGRTIQIRGGGSDWDWYGYCRNWQPQDVLDRCQLTAEDVLQAQDWWRSRVRFLDPLGDWYDLLQFVSVERKRKLKGHALLAQRMYAMEWMLRLFYQELTGDELDPPYPHPIWYLGDGEPEEHRHGDPRFLQFIANRYHLNAQVRLVLYLEGEGEFLALPQTCIRVFGFSFEGLGIEIRNLIGVPGFEGPKQQQYGALEKAIEELHDRQMLTFVILDNEGKRVHKLKKRLTENPSQYHPNRTFTRKEYLRIWDKNIEFDNFTDEEIAEVLTETAGAVHEFSAEEVSKARAEFGSKGDPLERLLKDKSGHGYGSKVAFLGRLFQSIDRSEVAEQDKRHWRPILVVLDTIITLASLNHQPTLKETARGNQASGYFGHPTEGSPDQASALLRDLRVISAN